MTPEPKRRGRPTLPPEQRQTEYVRIRLTRALREKYERLGGMDWFRRQLDKARV